MARETPIEEMSPITKKKFQTRNRNIINRKYRYVGCDPDTKIASYAIVDEKGGLVDSWTIHSKTLEKNAIIHATEPQRVFEEDAHYIIGVESQQVYSDGVNKAKSLLKVAKSSGISMMYLCTQLPNVEDLQLILPRKWTKGKPKKAHQFHSLTKTGLRPLVYAERCYSKELLNKHSKVEQYHVIDAIGIAQFMREEHQKELKLKAFKAQIDYE